MLWRWKIAAFLCAREYGDAKETHLQEAVPDTLLKWRDKEKRLILSIVLYIPIDAHCGKLLCAKVTSFYLQSLYSDINRIAIATWGGDNCGLEIYRMI